MHKDTASANEPRGSQAERDLGWERDLVSRYADLRSRQDEQKSAAGAEGYIPPKGGMYPTSGIVREQKPVSQFLDEPEEEIAWLIQGMLQTGGLGIVSARPKVGKSVLLRSLAVQVARGRPWLGRDTLSGPVGLMQPREARGEMRRQLRLLGAENPLYIYDAAPPAPATEFLAWLRLELTVDAPALLVLDTLSDCIQMRDFNDYNETTEYLGALMDVCRESGSAIIVGHHNNKAEAGGEIGILGSTGISASVDTMLILRKLQDKRRVLSTVQRYGTELEETVLTLHPDYSLSLDGTVEDQEREKVRHEILITIQEESCTRDELVERVGGYQGLVQEVLKELHQQGHVRREGRGKRGDPFRWSLN